MFERALGRPIESAEVQAVVAALGGIYEERRIDRGIVEYDPDLARTVAWDFPEAPRANRYAASNLGVRDGVVVWITLAPQLVGGEAGDRTVSFELPSEDRDVYKPWGDQWNWAPTIIRRGESFLLDLAVSQGHGEGSYRFPLTPAQAHRLQADERLYRQVWDGLVRLCQTRRFLDDPSTLPADAQSFLGTVCGSD